MKRTVLVLILFLTSCTRIRKLPKEEFSLMFFPNPERPIVFYFKDPLDYGKVNPALTIKYRTCYTRFMGNDFDYLKPLKDSFYLKFKAPLIGLANGKVRTYTVHDSSFFVPNETCKEIIANPMMPRLFYNDSKGEFALDDPRHHVH